MGYDLDEALAGLNLQIPEQQLVHTNVSSQPLDVCRYCLAEVLTGTVGGSLETAFESIQLSNNPLHGDFTVVLPKLCPGSNAEEVATTLIEKFPTDHSLFCLPWSDGVRLRFCLKPGTFAQLLIPFIIARKENYGLNKSFPEHASPTNEDVPPRIVVEFSSPNIASEFQGKHLRSTILGAFISNIYEKHGWYVTRFNYLGDWGKDIALLGIGWEKFGSNEAFANDPITHLLDIYQKIHELFLPELLASKSARDEAKKNNENEQEVTAVIEGKGLFAERNEFFKRLEEGDDAAVSLCQRIREVMLDNYRNFYGRLGIKFDIYSGESEIRSETMSEIEDLMRERGLLEEIGGSWVIDMKNCGAKSGIAIIRDRSGSSTYFLRYLAAVLDRSRNLAFDKMIFVAADKTGHYSRLIKVFEALGLKELADKLQHVSFNDTSHMIDSIGHGQQPHEILDQCESGALDALEENKKITGMLGTSKSTAEAIGTTMIICQELATKRASDHAFDLKSMTNFKPGTGLYFEFWNAKLHEYLQAHPPNYDLLPDEYQQLVEEDQTSLLLVLGQYPEIVQTVLKSLEPATIVTYLHNVIAHLEDVFAEDNEEQDDAADAVNPGNKDQNDIFEEDVEDEEDADGDRIAEAAECMLYEATRQVLENGMRLLGLVPLVGRAEEHSRVDTPVGT
ncbi:Nucleotidylyl transferase [Aaosphaeria arxii CBS 175.79]|uniref:arginine--tRNA ligase n=1 Tax=Aaosphaeria arxii CBS 175.79 TaxID=1450172 RepID=A0A6A5XS04_9PLEO|nr:Nucleotidylyl transferase [Aaosphaeria arxii CBS 175.79]KAF2016078.1 Nucleotidylyl transferase [Aaosphaeria arxii CBS 175.79]